MHTEAVCLFLKVIGEDQYLIQQIITTLDETYLSDIHNKTTNSINDSLDNVLTHLQCNYVQLMPHELLENKDKLKKNICHLFKPTVSVISVVK